MNKLIQKAYSSCSAILGAHLQISFQGQLLTNLILFKVQRESFVLAK